MENTIDVPTTYVGARGHAGKYPGRVKKLMDNGERLIELEDCITVGNKTCNQVIMKPVVIFIVKEYI